MYPRRILEPGSFRTLRAVQSLRQRRQAMLLGRPRPTVLSAENIVERRNQKVGRGHARQKQFRVTTESLELMGLCAFSSVLWGASLHQVPYYLPTHGAEFIDLK
jgi:hypothetical protein